MTQLQAEHNQTVLLDRELKFWETNREILTQRYPNEWLLIRGERVLGHFATYDQASVADRTLDAPLMHFVSRDDPACDLPSVFAVAVDA